MNEVFSSSAYKQSSSVAALVNRKLKINVWKSNAAMILLLEFVGSRKYSISIRCLLRKLSSNRRKQSADTYNSATKAAMYSFKTGGHNSKPHILTYTILNCFDLIEKLTSDQWSSRQRNGFYYCTRVMVASIDYHVLQSDGKKLLIILCSQICTPKS